MTISLQGLQKKVEARNQVNSVANQLQAVLQKTLAKYSGKKVVRKTPYKGWTASIAKLLNKIVAQYEQLNVRISFDIHFYNVYGRTSKGYVAEGGKTFYVENSFYICSLEEGERLSDGFAKFIQLRSDYTVDEVAAASARLDEIESEACDLKSQYREFI